METQLIRFAPAKLNLHLAVGEIEQDGLHAIQSLFVTTDLTDTIRVTAKTSKQFSITVTGLEEYCKPGSDTITKAATLYHEATSLSYSLSVHCDKRIPTQAGLGGGSSDAAAMLLILQELAGEHKLCDGDLFALAHRVGSDVSFFVSEAKAAIVEGRGDTVTSIEGRLLPCLLVFPKELSVSTKEAYGALDAMENRQIQFVEPQEIERRFKDSIPNWGKTFYNDFTRVLIELPFFRELERVTTGFGGYQGLSGSGPSWYFVVETEDDLDQIEKKIITHFGEQCVTYRLTMCS